ncbi:polysaccharide biosynthesis tyrosine autokinase [Rubripirellula amarantea]|uniref:non-specific protein-tyrosine kinase n=1 Tax=Rubripirellula amarantea TaxID=2527999 RepID=A0A5C5WTY6_9BACT|nr:polysaccharide biosynthesis tyrosine autokinase [Rubripirellula amarantea]MDA8745607.1 polysaccharide biosynthesis tyrosine autokinase [Rubripirellula amarantea]TWT54146.1 Tyrosine-protein kinase YwqD [Rubripirellula amarantea]
MNSSNGPSSKGMTSRLSKVEAAKAHYADESPATAPQSRRGASYYGYGYEQPKWGETINPLSIVRRRWKWIAGFACLGILATAIYLSQTPPTFRSQAKILVNPNRVEVGDSDTSNDVVDEDVLANHVELIRSRRTIESALNQAGLIAEPSIVAKAEPPEDTVTYVASNLRIDRGGLGAAKKARSLTVTFDHSDPVVAQQVLQAVIDQYLQTLSQKVDEILERSHRVVLDTQQQLAAKIGELEQRQKLARDQAPILFDGSNTTNVYEERYRSLQSELVSADLEVSKLRSRLEQVNSTIEQIAASDRKSDHIDKLALIDVESLQRMGVFTDMQRDAASSTEARAELPGEVERARIEISQVLELSSERQRLVSVFGSKHPKVADIEKQITLTKQFLFDQAKREEDSSQASSPTLDPEAMLKAYVGFLRNDLASHLERKTELQRLVELAEEQAREFVAFERSDRLLQNEIDRQRALFDGVMERVVNMNSAGDTASFTQEILEDPRVGELVWPKPLLCLALGLLGGVLVGSGVGVSREFMDQRFASVEQFETALGLQAFGVIDDLSGIELSTSPKATGNAKGSRETFRLTRTILAQSIQSRGIHSMGITSPTPGDGKSTMVSHLSTSFIRSGMRVLLIDADLRRPTIHKLFGLPNELGLSQFISGSATLDEVIQSTKSDDFKVITSGEISLDSPEWLQTAALEELLRQTEDFDLVLFDLPPVLAVSDAAVVLPRLDASLLVSRVATNKRHQVINAAKRIDAAGGQWIGALLNIVQAPKEFHEQGYGYQSDSYRSRIPVKSQPSKMAAIRSFAAEESVI